MNRDESPAKNDKQRVERVLEQGLERVDSPRAAHAVVARVERMTAGHTEAEEADQAARQAPSPHAAAARVEQTAQTAPPRQALAETLTTAAAESVAPSPVAPVVLEAAQAALTPSAPVSPRAQRGRELLKQAVLHRMGPLQALDARVYMLVNGSHHPGWLDSVAWAIAIITIGGWLWVIGALVAYLLRVPRSMTAVKWLLPSVVGATWIVEGPVKAYFRRRRPFVDVVRALVIGKKPGSWSFPSGHTASSFASAWVLSTVWPRRSPLFLALAGCVGLSRVYVGAHYPGDVLSGAAAGMVLSELIRRLTRRLIAD